jgi:hypothetical protein
MAKKKSTDISEPPITLSEIQTYLESQDSFAFEMYVYNLLKDLKFDARHGGTYEDPITKKHRQYDIRASLCHPTKNTCIKLAIECKHLQENSPLLISRTRITPQEARYHLITVSPSTAYRPVSVKLDNLEKFYLKKLYIGKSVSQIIRNENRLISRNEEIHDRWTQALSSAKDLVSGVGLTQLTQQIKVAIIPVLVVPDKTLWVADYSDRGALEGEPKQINEVVLVENRVYQIHLPNHEILADGFAISHLHIFTQSGIRSFLEDCANENGSFVRGYFR